MPVDTRMVRTPHVTGRRQRIETLSAPDWLDCRGMPLLSSTSTTEHSLVGNLTCLRRVLIIKNEGMHHSPTIGLWCFWCSKELWAWRSSAEQGSRDSGFGWRWRKAEHHPARQRIADQLICRFMDV